MKGKDMAIAAMEKKPGESTFALWIEMTNSNHFFAILTGFSIMI
jgi:hypothetical protein